MEINGQIPSNTELVIKRLDKQYFEIFVVKESDFLKSAFEKGDRKDLEKVIQIIEESGAIGVVQEETEAYTNKCMNLLDKFDNSIYKECLKTIVIDLKERTT